MNPLYPEKSDGSLLKLNDRIRLEDGTAVTVREFLQLPELSGGLTFGELALGAKSKVENFTLTQNTRLSGNILQPDPLGVIFLDQPEQGGGLRKISAEYSGDGDKIANVVVPEFGNLIFAISPNDQDPFVLFSSPTAVNTTIISFSIFGGQIQVYYGTTIGGTLSEGTLPPESVGSEIRLILENGQLSIEGIPSTIFSLPYIDGPQTKVTFGSISNYTVAPAQIEFTLFAGSGVFVKPNDWVVGKIYEVTSSGSLYGYNLVVGDHVVVSGSDEVIPIRFGDFISRLEVVGIISQTVDGYIVSAPVQTLIAQMFNIRLNAQFSTGSLLHGFILDSIRNSPHRVLIPTPQGNTLDYDGPSNIFIHEQTSNVLLNVLMTPVGTPARTFKVIINRTTLSVNREVQVAVINGSNTGMEYGGDLTLIGSSSNSITAEMLSETGAVLNIDVYPDLQTVFVVATKLSNPASNILV